MKRFVVFIMALLFTAIIGCDGDGDGSEVPPPAPGHVPGTGTGGGILDRGTATVPGAIGGMGVITFLCNFNVSETGTLEGRLTWSGGPTELRPYLMHLATMQVEHTEGTSPQYVYMEVTQALLDQGHNWRFDVTNYDPNPTEVEYRVKFTPN